MLRKWVFYIFAAVFILLSLATVALWMRSYSWYDSVSRSTATVRYTLASAEGTCSLGRDQFVWLGPRWKTRPMPARWERAATPSKPLTEDWNYVQWSTQSGFCSVQTGFHFTSNGGNFELNLPHWFISLCFALIGVVFVVLNQLHRFATISGESRRRMRRAVRLLAIGITTVGIILPLAVLVFGYNAGEGWAAVWNTPAIYLLFITIPIAGIVLASGTLRVQKLRLGNWSRRHLCAQCGYNLKGNTSGVCPECGMASGRSMPKA